jgi:hypothetical protein
MQDAFPMECFGHSKGRRMNLPSAREHLIMILECKATKRVRTRVAERVKNGICIGEDNGIECTKKARCRGLCGACEQRWRVTRMKMGPQDAASYDARLIRSGRLLSALGFKEYTRKSVYSRLA